MANENKTGASEILAIREAQKYPISPEARAVFDTSKGLTEQLYTQDVLRNFGAQAPAWVSAELQPETPTIPTMDVILDALKDHIKDDPKKAKGARTREQKFLEDFPKKQAEWKKAIESNPQFGEKGWRFVVDAWKAALHDETQKKIEAERVATLRGERGAGDGPLAGYIPKPIEDAIARAGGFASEVFTPRQFEALAAGREPSQEDVTGDVMENILMSIPGPSYVGRASRVLRLVPKVAEKIAANKAVANVLGNAVAPLATEVMDWGMRGADDPNAERAGFSVGDVGMGTATNLGVNYGLLRGMGGAGRILEGQLMRQGSGAASPIGRVARMLEGVGRPNVERGLPAPETLGGAAMEAAYMGLPTLIINRYGKDTDASFALNRVPELGNWVKERRQEEHQAMRDRATASQILKIETTYPDLTERDKDYLKAVRENPSVMKVGYVPDEGAEKKGRSSDDFNLWLLEKGHKLLRGTGAARSFAEIGRYE